MISPGAAPAGMVSTDQCESVLLTALLELRTGILIRFIYQWMTSLTVEVVDEIDRLDHPRP